MKKTGTFLLFLFFLSHFGFAQQPGARYTGSYKTSSPIQRTKAKNFVIEGLEFSKAPGNSIALYDCENVVIKNNKFSQSFGKASVYLYNCTNVTIVDCTFENVQSGLVASMSKGVKFEYNDVTNIVGPLKGGDKIGVMAQFIKVSGAGNSISYNVCENLPGESSPEDLVNIFQSNGTAESPIKVTGNWIRGGGPSNSGGGINLGDMGGSYQIAENNILVNPGQYGMGISGGNNMAIRNNKVFGARQSFTNVGITACNWYPNEGNSYNIIIADNQVNFVHKDGYVNNFWFAGNVGTVTGNSSNKSDRTLQASILKSQIIGLARVQPVTEGGATTQSTTSIYLDSQNRLCINTSEPLRPDASLKVLTSWGAEVGSVPVTRFHTVMSGQEIYPGTYIVVLTNGSTKFSQQIVIENKIIYN